MTVVLTRETKAAITAAILEKDKYITQIKQAYKQQYGEDLSDEEIDNAIKNFMKLPTT
jgi:hypothetical protein